MTTILSKLIQPRAAKTAANSTSHQSPVLVLFTLTMLAGLLLSACSSGTLTPTSWPGLTAKDDVLYVASSSYIIAVNSSGAELWRYPAEADRNKTFYAQPAITDDGKLIIGDYSKNLYAIDTTSSGAELWTVTKATKRYIGSPLITSDAIYVPNTDNNLYAFDLKGQYQWKFETKHSLWASPVTDGKMIYQPSMDHFLYAIDIETQKEVWSVDLGGSLVAPFLLDENGILYGGTLAKEIVAVDSSTHEIRWHFATKGNVWSTPVLKDGVLYFGDSGGTIYAVNANDGAQKWSVDTGSPVIASVALYDGGMIVGTEDGKIHQISFDGSKKIWARTIEGKLYTTPVILGDKIVFAVTNSKTELLIAFDLSGNELWTYLPE